MLHPTYALSAGAAGNDRRQRTLGALRIVAGARLVEKP